MNSTVHIGSEDRVPVELSLAYIGNVSRTTVSGSVRWYFNEHVPPAVSIVSFPFLQTPKSSSSAKGERFVMERSAQTVTAPP